MKNLILLIALLVTAPAFAQSAANSQSGSLAQNAGVTANNTVVMPNSSPNTYARVDGSTNQAASGPSVFVNPPSADTCERAGFGASVGTVGANAGVNIPRGMSVECNMRADTVNLKFTQAPQAVIKARHCMDPNMAEAYARAGEPCVDRRPVATAPLLP